MAAPAEATLLNLNGNWQIDKTVSSDPDPLFQLQGISWLTRTAISLATVTIGIKQYKEEDYYRMDATQTLTGGIPGTSEERKTNWTENDHTDHIFGHCIGQSRLVDGTTEGSGNGKARPNLDIQIKVGNEEEDELVRKFLLGEIMPDGSESDGWEPDQDNKWLQNYVRNQDNGWIAEQIWGFEIINGERYHTRRVVCTNNGQTEKLRLIYGYVYE